MHWYYWLLLAMAIYLVLGVISATIFMQTPYAVNGWLVLLLLWPLFVIWG